MTERKIDEFQEKFPEKWICPYCMAELGEHKMFPREDILSHVKAEHPDNVNPKITWEEFYNRMNLIGGI